ncbi:hypothetical protein C8A00DRAFT_42034 [Chaetomidium leptoderma]|uniref:Uncharacterized protein n=1 Tax=Chaetomidium leptoderma TaxID=669021 RepID=A0AAN6VQ87_9PEZI|nr:hypothetical protein C8A00DRAFT_42034 [Chaetomidium leptoderma]
MLCGMQPHSSHQHHGFLRSFRSHKSLRNKSDSLGSQEEMHRHCRHRPSDASSLARPSLDSTSSRTEMSIDWDPLAMHPPTLAQGPSQLPQELRSTRSSHAVSQPPSSSRHHHQSPSPSSNTVIYDGFDFGFNNNPTRAMSKTTTPTSIMGGGRRAPSPTPSDASSEWSLSGSCSSDGSPQDDDELIAMMGMGRLGGLAPAPAPNSRPRLRPRHHNSPLTTGASGRPPLLNDDAEYFIRRGGWKRRGIVFVDSDLSLAGEDETFEI